MELKNIVHMIVLILIPLGFFLLSPGMSDAGYSELVENPFLGDFGAEAVSAFVLVAVMAAGLLFYKAEKEENMSFIVALFILLSPYLVLNVTLSSSPLSAISFLLLAMAYFVARKVNVYAAVVPLIIAVIIWHPIEPSLNNIMAVGLILPLSALVLIKKEKEAVGGFIVGVIISVFSPVYGLAVLAFSGNRALDQFSKNLNDKKFWFLGVFAIVLYLLIPSEAEGVFQTVLAAAGVTGLFYLVLSLYKFDGNRYLYIALAFLLALSFGNSFVEYHLNIVSIPSEDSIEAFKILSGKGGEVGIMEFSNAFRFYSGKEGMMLNAGELIENKSLGVDYIVLSSTGLYKKFENRSIVFSYGGGGLNDQGRLIGMFVNRNYVLYTELTGDLEPTGDGTIQDRKSGLTINVPFTKLRKFNEELPLNNPNNLLINTQNIDGSNLYLILTSEPLYQENGVKVVEVK